MIFSTHIFREYDIRGVFEKDFDLDFCETLAFSFTEFVKSELNIEKPKISLGRDVRLSSPKIKKAVISGFLKAGVEIIDLDTCTTPLSYFSLKLFSLDATCMITASHNPKEFNGFKFSLKNKSLYGEKLQILRKFVETCKLKKNYQNSEKKTESTKKHFLLKKKQELIESYIQDYKKEFDFQNNKLHFVVDCGSGTSGIVARKLFSSLGLLGGHFIFETPDGNFPYHHPDPSVEKNLSDLKKTVIEKKAKIGLAFDGDCDRLGVVDETGTMISMDRLLALYSQFVLKEHRGAQIVADLKCSDVLFEEIEKNGGSPVMWKTGHSLIKQKIKSLKAPFGGELSGHIFFNDRREGFDDALYAALRLLEILHKTKKTFKLFNEKKSPCLSTHLRFV